MQDCGHIFPPGITRLGAKLAVITITFSQKLLF